jgi:2,4-dienoyl-CoA reductase-like NADH-dependent reductase (Old Yellow Enzyme family)
MSRLFEPFSIGDLRLDNRIVIAPMCQYSAIDGVADELALVRRRSRGCLERSKILPPIVAG